MSEEDSKEDDTKSSDSAMKSQTPSEEICPWSKLKQAAIVRDNTSICSDQTLDGVDCVAGVSRKTKPGLLDLEHGRTKQYESVDDLSPEYCGLPFVKKLKILNERQKLAELEHVMKARSVSLDIPGDTTQHDETMQRSRSEASAMHSCNTLDVALTEIPPPSPESNETIGKYLFLLTYLAINTVTKRRDNILGTVKDIAKTTSDLDSTYHTMSFFISFLRNWT